MDIRATSDRGQPIVATEPESEHARLYTELAGRVWSALDASGEGAQKPVVTASPDGRALSVAMPSGEQFELPAEMLRVMSPSAEVQGHAPSQRVTVGGKRNVSISGLEPVGGYAVRIRFSDGHDTGLFTWPYLEELGHERDARWAAYLAELSAKGMSRD
ncbi:MAG: DUF971 domain-containing protein [Hyphomicrobiaceae bacterium]|nr:DUF971 domain-containing protein [Hyphomicrobiaceae bacterium]